MDALTAVGRQYGNTAYRSISIRSTSGNSTPRPFGRVTKASYRAPYPTRDVRHASDISVADSSRLLIASASDEGDDGPFDSAVSDAGSVSLDRSGRVRLTLSRSPEILRKFKGHKVEAVDCVSGSDTAVLGTDDENAGGALTTARICH
ncbi:hypothetical protein [Streptomyces eurythermus]|uniref:hypothetical protein n=1 Tax=Streptomyces eurythermus TaxID=42237 RepID=UPI0036F8E93F